MGRNNISSETSHLRALQQNHSSPQILLMQEIVKERYAEASRVKEEALCCPVDYDPKYLKVIPSEVIEKDYGCGDPSKYLNPGETVLDLGSGTGKICFIASQVVGPEGKVIGVDMTDDMLEVARRNAPVVAEKIGYANVKFLKGTIEDLGMDLESLEKWLKSNPVQDLSGFHKLRSHMEEMTFSHPLVKDNSVDVVVSNCVLNLVAPESKRQLFQEIFRVLKPGGRAVISDIVSDTQVPEAMQADADLWSGCISGALSEEEFVSAFVDAGFHGVEILELQPEPWRTVNDIEFRSMTICAWKPHPEEMEDEEDSGMSAIYKGPFWQVVDDEGCAWVRGSRKSLNRGEWRRFRSKAYSAHFTFPDAAPIGGSCCDSDSEETSGTSCC